MYISPSKVSRGCIISTSGEDDKDVSKKFNPLLYTLPLSRLCKLQIKETAILLLVVCYMYFSTHGSVNGYSGRFRLS